MQCAICLDAPKIPTCGENCQGDHYFCKDCIECWERRSPQCPVCRKDLRASELGRNVTRRRRMDRPDNRLVAALTLPLHRLLATREPVVHVVTGTSQPTTPEDGTRRYTDFVHTVSIFSDEGVTPVEFARGLAAAPPNF